MNVRELKEKLEECKGNTEIGIADFGEVYEITGIDVILFGNTGIEGMIYALKTTEEIDEVENIRSSIHEKVVENMKAKMYDQIKEIEKLQALNRDLVDVLKKILRFFNEGTDPNEGMKFLDEAWEILEKTKVVREE